MAQHGKKYVEQAKKIDIEKMYAPTEALQLAKETSYAKFNATIEVHFRLGVDPRQADQLVRGVVVLPAGLGKVVRVMVFAQGDGARLAQESGADHVYSTDEELKKIQDGWTDWDISIAMADMMGKIGRLGKVLGTRGLMPSPKAGTITQNAGDLPRMIKEAKAGRVEFRVDKTSGVHVPIGKASFALNDLVANFEALMDAMKKAKPSGVKGIYIKKVSVAATMGPGVRIDPNLAQSMEAVA
ncbi:MAG TPA: 50S ribosomal protein L1 [Anaerolineae bacterium]|jgi:large subunit ribosomal protein L1|nr:50S ribosomal protein L1 [Anaerolineae bacterium]